MEIKWNTKFLYIFIPIPPVIRKLLERKYILHFQPSMDTKFILPNGKRIKKSQYSSQNPRLRFGPKPIHIRKDNLGKSTKKTIASFK